MCIVRKRSFTMHRVRFLVTVVTIIMFAVTSLPVQAQGKVPDPGRVAPRRAGLRQARTVLGGDTRTHYPR